jgi:NADH dehydrogenase
LGRNLVAQIRGGEMQPFRYEPKGTVASLGRKEAIGIVGQKKLYGSTASLMKKFIDLRWLFILGGVSLVLRKGKL